MSQVRVGEVFKAAIRRNATAVINVHNHPSGDPTPSPDDVAVTRAFVQAGKLIDVEVLDHIIIGQGRHVSMKERGLGFA
jgi:DNA repair protein RadC